MLRHLRKKPHAVARVAAIVLLVGALAAQGVVATTFMSVEPIPGGQVVGGPTLALIESAGTRTSTRGSRSARWAYLLGYSEPAAFDRAFRQYAALSPGKPVVDNRVVFPQPHDMHRRRDGTNGLADADVVGAATVS